MSQIRSFSFIPKRVIVVAITVDTVGVQLVNVVLEVDDEESATSRFGVDLTGILPILLDFWIDKRTVVKILHLTPRQSLESHYTVTNHNSFEVDLECFTLVELVVLVNQDSQVRNILSCIGLPSNPKTISCVLRELFKEVQHSVQVVMRYYGIVVFEGSVSVVGIADTCRSLEK